MPELTAVEPKASKSSSAASGPPGPTVCSSPSLGNVMPRLGAGSGEVVCVGETGGGAGAGGHGGWGGCTRLLQLLLLLKGCTSSSCMKVAGASSSGNPAGRSISGQARPSNDTRACLRMLPLCLAAASASDDGGPAVDALDAPWDNGDDGPAAADHADERARSVAAGSTPAKLLRLPLLTAAGGRTPSEVWPRRADASGTSRSMTAPFEGGCTGRSDCVLFNGFSCRLELALPKGWS